MSLVTSRDMDFDSFPLQPKDMFASIIKKNINHRKIKTRLKWVTIVLYTTVVSLKRAKGNKPRNYACIAHELM